MDPAGTAPWSLFVQEWNWALLLIWQIINSSKRLQLNFESIELKCMKLLGTEAFLTCTGALITVVKYAEYREKTILLLPLRGVIWLYHRLLGLYFLRQVLLAAVPDSKVVGEGVARPSADLRSKKIGLICELFYKKRFSSLARFSAPPNSDSIRK